MARQLQISRGIAGCLVFYAMFEDQITKPACHRASHGAVGQRMLQPHRLLCNRNICANPCALFATCTVVALQALTYPPGSTTRLIYIAAFAVSGYASTKGRTSKPFNPLLGETYELVHQQKVRGRRTQVACVKTSRPAQSLA